LSRTPFSPCKSLGQFDEDASVGWIPDLVERDDETQARYDIELDLIFPKQ
jgi:hypothetical protein